MLSCSIVIPTKNRKEDLQETFKSILKQTVSPKEVIVVDDSDDDLTEDLIENNRKYFAHKGIPLKYFRGNTNN